MSSSSSSQPQRYRNVNASSPHRQRVVNASSTPHQRIITASSTQRQRLSELWNLYNGIVIVIAASALHRQFHRIVYCILSACAKAIVFTDILIYNIINCAWSWLVVSGKCALLKLPGGAETYLPTSIITPCMQLSPEFNGEVINCVQPSLSGVISLCASCCCCPVPLQVVLLLQFCSEKSRNSATFNCLLHAVLAIFTVCAQWCCKLIGYRH